MLNKLFLEGIIAQKPVLQKARNGEDFTVLILICKPDQPRLKKDNIPIPLYPDNIIPVMFFGSKANYITRFREACDVVRIEGCLQTPNRKVVVKGEKIDLVKSKDYVQRERKIRDEIEEERINEYNNH